ncbi:TPA: glycosyltransferase family 32 protein [Streptococcus suis]
MVIIHMIPKKIHYCWFGKGKHSKEMKKCIKSWKKYCPDYEIIEWNESNFDISAHPFVKAAYEAKAWAFVSDYARLKIIYDYGGVYLDTDVELIRNIDFLLQNDAYLGVEAQDWLCNTGLGFGAKKHNSIIAEMLQIYNEIEFDNSKKSTIACPYLNTAVVEKIGYKKQDRIQQLDKITIYPPKYFDPFPSGGSVSILICDETVSIHHYSASWGSWKNKLKRRIARFIGPKLTFKLKKFKNIFNN